MAALADARAKAGQQILLREEATAAQCNSALRPAEHRMVADSAPTTSKLVMHGDEFEGCPSIRAGERPGHLEHPRGIADGLHAQRAGPRR